MVDQTHNTPKTLKTQRKKTIDDFFGIIFLSFGGRIFSLVINCWAPQFHSPADEQATIGISWVFLNVKMSTNAAFSQHPKRVSKSGFARESEEESFFTKFCNPDNFFRAKLAKSGGRFSRQRCLSRHSNAFPAPFRSPVTDYGGCLCLLGTTIWYNFCILTVLLPWFRTNSTESCCCIAVDLLL